MAPLSIFEILKGNDRMITKVEINNETMAIGLALNTKSNFFKKVKIEKQNINMILNNFYDKKKLSK
jgi:hypothetical protein